MKVKFWGIRGSIPVSGRQYIKYGGSTTCVEINSSDNQIIIVDAGTGIRPLGKELLKSRHRDFTMLFTHSHWDHVLGFPFFAPIYDKRTRIRVMGCSFSSDTVREIVAKTMQPPGFPVKFEEISAKFVFDSMCCSGSGIGTLSVIPIELSHPNQGLGYKFQENGNDFVFLTDNELGFIHPGGHGFSEYLEFARGARLLVHDADYTGAEYPKRKTWGHSTYQQALELAIKAEVENFGLCHHNQERSDADIERILADCRKILKSAGSKTKCFAVKEGQEIELS